MDEDRKLLKKALDAAREGHKRWHHLLHRREELETMLGDLHGKPQILKELKTKMQELDTLLDTLEEFSTEHIETLQKRLIHAILNQYPDERLFIEKTSQGLTKTKAQTDRLQNLTHLTENTLEALDKALQAGKGIRGFGILSYIFGNSPTIVISQYLKRTEDFAKETLRVIEDTHTETLDPLNPPLKLLYKELQLRWSFRRLDRVFTPIHDDLKVGLQFLKEKRQNAEEQQNALEKALNDWLERFSTS